MDKRRDQNSVSIMHRRLGADCLYIHQNDPVTKKPLPTDPADVQRLNGKPQTAPKAPAGPPPPAQSSTVPISTPSATPKPVVRMIRVDRRDLEPEAEPGARHSVARWRMTEGATVPSHPIGRVPEPKGGIAATPHFGGLHGGRTHFGSNQSSMWCRCQLCGINTPTVTYQDVCCTACYRLPPRGQRTWTVMKVFFANRHPRRAAILQLQDRVRRYIWSCNTTLPCDTGALWEEVRRREIERAQAMGILHLFHQRMNNQQHLDNKERESNFYLMKTCGRRHDREKPNPGVSSKAVSSFQAADEQRSHTRVVRGVRYSPTGTPRRRTRIELSGVYSKRAFPGNPKQKKST